MIFDKFKKKNDGMIIPSKTRIEDLLPIGSVVKVLDIEHRLMIIGIKQISTIDNHEYDYVTVPYPGGQIGIDSQLLINNEDIVQVSFIGCQDSERFAFIDNLMNKME